MTADDPAPLLNVSATQVDGVCVLTVDGVLDSLTYRPLRDAVIKAALDAPRAVVVDVSALDVPVRSTWSVFTSARWHVGQWPDVPIALICAHRSGRDAIKRNGISHYVPVYDTVAAVCIVVTALIENVLQHTVSAPRLRL